MAKKDFCYCYGKGCSLKFRCERYLDGLRVLGEKDLLWMDECGDYRDSLIFTEPRF